MASTLRPLGQPILPPGADGIDVFRAAGCDVCKAAHHLIEQPTSSIHEPQRPIGS